MCQTSVLSVRWNKHGCLENKGLISLLGLDLHKMLRKK